MPENLFSEAWSTVKERYTDVYTMSVGCGELIAVDTCKMLAICHEAESQGWKFNIMHCIPTVSARGI